MQAMEFYLMIRHCELQVINPNFSQHGSFIFLMITVLKSMAYPSQVHENMELGNNSRGYG